ncbi:MAG TPA: shikimate dehydrogenase [Solirubrobacterales bacterium]
MPRLAVIGFPVAHSRSPAMQNAALEALGLAGEWSYRAVEATPAAFEMTVRELASLGYAGVNVTVPHKEAALKLADEASEAARQIGAANTLSFAGKRIAAGNTDAEGLLRSLPEALRGEGLRGRRALVLGAGGAARAVLWALVGAGAEVAVWNRTAERAERICAELGGSPVAEPDQGEQALIVNTSAAGLKGEDPFEHLPLSRGRFGAEQTVVDMVYGERPSQLLEAAAAAGAATVDGLEVLVQQGALSLRIWTGLEPPIEVMRAAVRR